MRALDRVVLLLLGVGVLALVLGLRAAPSQDSGQRLASADLLSLVEEILRTDEYAEPRIAMESELLGQMNELQAQYQTLAQQLQTMQPGDPLGQQVYASMQSKQAELQQFQQSAIESLQQSSAEQAKEAYARVRRATTVVSDREGFTHVIACRSDAAIGEAPNLTAVTQEILARPMAVGADRNDLTAKVRDELGLPDPATLDAMDDAGAAGEDAGDPAIDASEKSASAVSVQV